jgi:hypothetical protein
MNKKIKKYNEILQFRQWWWTSFLPNYLENIINKSNFNNLEEYTSISPAISNNNTNEPLRLNSSTFTPLSKDNFLIKNNILSIQNSVSNNSSTSSVVDSSLPEFVNPSGLTNIKSSREFYSSSTLSQETKGSISNTISDHEMPFVPPVTVSQTPFTSTNIPFYAGWDESLRKFVVTNRLLTRRDTGLFVQNQSKTALNASIIPTGISKPLSNSQQQLFSTTPIQGLNEGSFLYSQNSMPFNAYIIDQFITTNQSFYAPLGWRRFEFSHLLLKTWETQKNKSTVYNITRGTKGSSIDKNNSSTTNKGLIINISHLDNKFSQTNKILTNKLVSRRVKKRYKLVKQTPNILMYSPTGPLLTEVLPSHYISVFDQQYRFPRNVYLKRNNLKTLKKITLQAMQQTSTKEFTLRKRVKPRRKYHKKRVLKTDNLIFPRRTKFIIDSKDFVSNSSQDNLRWRPSLAGKAKLKEGQIGSSNFTAQNMKSKSNKRVKTNPLRLRQLRRRELQQVIKPLQRYIPQNGGFTWPGDFLRLETVDMPKLQSVSVDKSSLKQKINVQPVGLMPRKYLIDKHNIRVLKKKLEKAYATQQFTKVVREYKNLLQN